MKTPMKLKRSMKRKHRQGGFAIEILFPGLPTMQNDSGIGAIGRIDHARIVPGAVIAMHPHKDDEILTYLRSGRLIHRDTIGDSQEISNTRLMLMNAGHSFQHEEESLPEGGLLEGLQIFIRPRQADLEPQVQFHDFGAASSDNTWRLIAGPADAPLILRAQAWVYDTRLAAGNRLELLLVRAKTLARLLYVFRGRVGIDGTTLEEGESLLIERDASAEVFAHEASDLVLFATDLDAPVFKGGMFSGNVLAAT